MDSTVPEVTAEPQVVFRGKKRKTYRRRAEDEGLQADQAHEGSVPEAPATPDAARAQSPDEHEDGLSVAEVLRRRNARKSRLGGVRFGGDSNSRGDAAADGEVDDLSLMIREEENRALDMSTIGVNKRFAPQTGLSGELVNRHMMEYIEAELARRHNATSSTQAATQEHRLSSQLEYATINESSITKKPDQHTALQGKLMEIDLGDEVRTRNEAMTERATRRLQGEAVEDEEQSARPKKVRLGKDGKPWRSRNRRNSDDIRRDQLVEEILRENRLDVYESTTPPPTGVPGVDEEDGAADDRIAEEFRREFMDAMAQRQQKKKPAAPPGKPGAKKDEDVLKGPKLGGSRNARAAMRDLLLKKEKEGRK
ncbi:hypothetical protein F5B20DRAFT_445464 [Whalleya microplaca]|nr:hypothetical protein F5B20DRAFT_445464 [Whalleya microplaca]